MKKIKHIIFWSIVIGIILLLFSSYVIGEDVLQRQRDEWVSIIKDDVVKIHAFPDQGALDERVGSRCLRQGTKT